MFYNGIYSAIWLNYSHYIYGPSYIHRSIHYIFISLSAKIWKQFTFATRTGVGWLDCSDSWHDGVVARMSLFEISCRMDTSRLENWPLKYSFQSFQCRFMCEWGWTSHMYWSLTRAYNSSLGITSNLLNESISNISSNGSICGRSFRIECKVKCLLSTKTNFMAHVKTRNESIDVVYR